MLRVGSDCSGMETAIYALEQLSISYSHEWSCDIDKYARETILSNYNPKRYYNDMTTRNVNDLPDIDLYICGFPCQPFSIAGKMKGLDDKRGIIFFHCIDVINHKKPAYFILENVKGLYHHNHGQTFKIIMSELKKTGYNIYHKILNSKSYNCPQSRPRLYIIGIKDITQPFEFPEPIPLEKSLRDIVDYNDTSKRDVWNYIKCHVDRMDITDSFFDQRCVRRVHKINKNVSECLTAKESIYNAFIGRPANIIELLRLQGFKDTFNVVVSKTQMIKQIGNAMNVNVLMSIYEKLLIMYK